MYVIWFYLLTEMISVEAASSCEKDVKTRLLSNYDASLIPLQNSRGVMMVNLTAVRVTSLELQEDIQELIIKGWFVYSWWDEILTWTESECITDTLILDRGEFWTPDLEVFNSVSPSTTPSFPFKNGVLHRSGLIIVVSDTQLTVGCALNLYRYPFDHHQCPLVLGSWARTQKELDILIPSTSLVDIQMSSHTKWKILGVTATKDVKTYADGDVYSNLQLIFSFVREPDLVVFFAPLFVITLLCLLMICIPVSTEWKIIIGLFDTMFITYEINNSCYKNTLPTPGFILYLHWLSGLMALSTFILSISVYLFRNPPTSSQGFFQVTSTNNELQQSNSDKCLEEANTSKAEILSLSPSDQYYDSKKRWQVVIQFFSKSYGALVTLAIIILWVKFIPMKFHLA